MAIKIYYLRADWCAPCQQTDPYFLPDDQGFAGSFVDAYFLARQAGEIQFVLGDVTSSADQMNAEILFDYVNAPSIIFWDTENDEIITRLDGKASIEANFFDSLSALGIEPDPLEDIEYDVIKPKRSWFWLLLLLGIIYEKSRP